MSDDLTPPCPQCAITPHDEPDLPHVHLTDFGYVLYTPTHRMRDYIEEIREFERAAGRRQAADDLRQYALNYPSNVFPPDSDSRDAIGGTAMRHAYNNAARIAEGAPAEPVEGADR